MIKKITKIEELDVVNNKKFYIIDFSASWCGPCRMMEPVLEDFSTRQSEVDILKVDIDEFEELAMKYSVMYVPTFVVTFGGKELGRTSGFMEIGDFEKFVNDRKAEK